MPIVRFLTPAKATDSHTGLDAFADEIQNGAGLGYPYQPYYANSNTNLGPTATAAVTDQPMLDPTVTPKVIVTGGSMATEAVRTAVKTVVDAGGPAGDIAKTIAIVQGVGGTYYDNTTYNNITGFHISVRQTCIDQLHAIAAGAKVSVLYDSSDDTSRPVHDYLQTHPDGKHLTFYSKGDLVANPARIDQGTFMLIPNADFYNDRTTIVSLVEGRFNTPGTNVYAVYPEHEYKDLHVAGNKDRVTVRGHHVPHTYRKAARLTGRIWRREVSVGTLPQMVEAEKEP
jgi:hypothetical protein